MTSCASENHIQEKNQEVSQVEESDTKLAQALIVIMARDEELAAIKRGQSMLSKIITTSALRRLGYK